MVPLHEAVVNIVQTGEHMGPLTVVIALITAGLAIKSAMFPFHGWAPDTYAFAPPLSSAILSGIISKAYIFVLIKFFCRVIGLDVIISQQITPFLFVCGVSGMIIGSIMAISQRDIRRMIAYSSVAQIGYIYLGLGIGTKAGVEPPCSRCWCTAVKSVLFLSTYELVNVSGDHKHFRYLHGAGYRNVPAGIVFTIAAMSMVGIPFTGGFIVKLNLAISGIAIGGWVRALVLIALALSTLLNSVYFLHTVVSIYRRPAQELDYPKPEKTLPVVAVALFTSVLLIIYLGIGSEPILRVIETGLKTFS